MNFFTSSMPTLAKNNLQSYVQKKNKEYSFIPSNSWLPNYSNYSLVWTKESFFRSVRRFWVKFAENCHATVIS
jgi:hypothetical protein